MMNLKQVIKENNWLSVEETIKQLYPNQQESIDLCRNVYEKLNYLPEKENELLIVLTEYDCDPKFESTKKTYVDVSGRKKVEDPNDITNGYALEYVEWKEWLGMELAPETRKHFSDLEIIAHCLHEMTFVGYEETEIQEQLQSLTKDMEEYKSLSDVEKKEKTMTFEEFKRKHSNEDDSSTN